MQNIRSFSAYTIGEKHKAIGKVCQDHADHFEDKEKGIYISVVSDGHGSNRYFRSHIGAELLTGLTLESLQSFLENIDRSLLNTPRHAMPARTTIAEKELDVKPPAADKAFRQLFASIIAQWNDAIYTDWKENKPNEKEMENAGLVASEILSFTNDKNIEMAYGCTLIAIARTPNFWIGFQLGDGKCVAFDKSGNWSEPIPWDELCSGNITTSMCESNPLDNFRYAFGTDFYPAMFIGSDGMDGAYGSDEEMAIENLALLYSGMIKSFAKNGFEKSLTEIKEIIPQLSAKGVSQDDISVAGILDMEAIKEMYPLLLTKELQQIRKRQETIAKETEAKQLIVMELENSVNQNKEIFTQLTQQIKDTEEEKEQNTLNYKKAFKEKEKSQQKWEELQASLQKLETEINQLSDDLSYEKNYFRRILKEEENARQKIKKIEKKLNPDIAEDNFANNIAENQKTDKMVNQTRIMKTYLMCKLELAAIKNKLMNAEINAELTQLKKREEELCKEIEKLDKQLTEFKKDTIGNELKNNLFNLFERLKNEAQKDEYISKTEYLNYEAIFTKINDTVIDIVTREYIKPLDLSMVSATKHASDSIMTDVLVDFFENEKAEIKKIHNPDLKSISDYYIQFYERLTKLEEQEKN